MSYEWKQLLVNARWCSFVFKKYIVLLKFRNSCVFRVFLKEFLKYAKTDFETTSDLGNPTTQSPHFTGSPNVVS